MSRSTAWDRTLGYEWRAECRHHPFSAPFAATSLRTALRAGPGAALSARERLAWRTVIAYIYGGVDVFRVKGAALSDTGLQKLAFFLLVALILYVAVTGGA
jgi:hypothetical protein